MSAVLEEQPRLRPMHASDLEQVVAVEQTIYSHPWSLGNFRDSLQAGYSCWIMEHAGRPIAYGVLMIGVREAHLLNLSVAKDWQRQGMGRRMLLHFLDLARQCDAQTLMLEVRPSNVAARALYADMGFRELSVRRGYYPAEHGRENAILMSMRLV
jgi:ribosomal-protein-alanine N-acetyltransferase